MTPERYKKLTDWLEGRPALREGIILLNRWLPLVPFVCYPALLLLLNLRWFAMLRVGRGGGALDFMQVIARAILVPGLAFSANGARLGYGKGYYDTFFAQHPVLKLGLCYDFQLVPQVPTQPHDVRMDGFLTDKRLVLTADEERME